MKMGPARGHQVAQVGIAVHADDLISHIGQADGEGQSDESQPHDADPAVDRHLSSPEVEKVHDFRDAMLPVHHNHLLQHPAAVPAFLAEAMGDLVQDLAVGLGGEKNDRILDDDRFHDVIKGVSRQQGAPQIAVRDHPRQCAVGMDHKGDPPRQTRPGGGRDDLHGLPKGAG